jgi:hypothetical protein
MFPDPAEREWKPRFWILGIVKGKPSEDAQTIWHAQMTDVGHTPMIDNTK